MVDGEERERNIQSINRDLRENELPSGLLPPITTPDCAINQWTEFDDKEGKNRNTEMIEPTQSPLSGANIEAFANASALEK